MAEPDMQSEVHETVDAAGDAARHATEAGADAARAGIDAEHRVFAAAGDVNRHTAEAMGAAAQASLKAGQDATRHSQDLARRAADRAADFWRASLTPMTEMQGEVNRWFEQMWRQASPGRLGAGPFPGLLSPLTGQPLADLHETDKGLELNVELPGLKAGDITLSLVGDALVVSGEKRDVVERGEGAVRYSERRFGRFERSFFLPPGADRGAIAARFADGVLNVTIPRSPGADQTRTIPVQG